MKKKTQFDKNTELSFALRKNLQKRKVFKSKLIKKSKNDSKR
jgi:hypothetical protein